MAGIGILTRMFGTAISGAAGFAAGTAMGPVMTPIVQLLRNDVNAQFPYVPPDPMTLAEGVAQGQVDPDQAASWAAMHGIGDNAFAALVAIADTGPALGYAYQAWRRGTLTDAEFKTALKRTGLEHEWFAALEDLKHARLDEGAIATAVHRGNMEDAGLLVTPVPVGAGVIPQVPVSKIPTLEEFAALGIDAERARVLIANTGLPLSLGEMLQLYNRGEVTDIDVKRSIAQSNVRNEYMDKALKLARRLLTPHEYAEAELRGIMSRPEAQAGANLSGLSDEDYTTLFAILGRPLALHQITTGLARGGTFGGTYDDVPAGPYRDAIRRSAVRPEYASLDYANRYVYPGAFVLRTLAQAGDLGNEAAVEQILLEIGWKPSFAKQVASAWMNTTDAADPHVKKAQGTLFTEAHKAYVKTGVSVDQLAPAFTALNIPAEAQTEIVALWDAEKVLASDVPPVS